MKDVDSSDYHQLQFSRGRVGEGTMAWMRKVEGWGRVWGWICLSTEKVIHAPCKKRIQRGRDKLWSFRSLYQNIGVIGLVAIVSLEMKINRAVKVQGLTHCHVVPG